MPVDRYRAYSAAPRPDRSSHQAGMTPLRQASVRRSCAARRRGLSLIELLVSLAITAMLLTATMVAIDASFRAYAAAAESASKQTSTRLVTHRLLTLVRTSTAHGPLEPSGSSTWPVTMPNVNDATLLESKYIELIDSKGNYVRIEYREDDEELWVITEPYGTSTAHEHPLMGGVTECVFHVRRREDNSGVWVLERGSIDLEVQRDEDNTLAIETSSETTIRVVASTKPRKLK
ncbi:MAG: PulJ/GspJ family protein [bacterium]